MIGAFSLSIELISRSENNPLSVACRKPQKIDLNKLLKGRTRPEGFDLLPRIFSICSHAHKLACQRVLYPHAHVHETAPLEFLLLCENLREHILHIEKNWIVNPVEKNQEQQLSELLKSVLDFNKQAEVFCQNYKLQDVNDRRKIEFLRCIGQLTSLLETDIFQMHLGEWRSLKTVDGYLNWLNKGQNKIKDFLRYVKSYDDKYPADFQSKFIPDKGDVWASYIFQKQDQIYGNVHEGPSPETSPFATYHQTDLLREIISKFGPGLLARFTSKLSALAALPRQITHYLLEGADKIDLSYLNHDQQNQRLGIAQTSRGRLSHLATYENDQIIDYKIIAPTDLNFLKHGPLDRLAAQLQGPLTQEKEKMVDLMIRALDPCFPYSLKVAAHA